VVLERYDFTGAADSLMDLEDNPTCGPGRERGVWTILNGARGNAFVSEQPEVQLRTGEKRIIKEKAMVQGLPGHGASGQEGL
jgi:hypothetical protein